MERYSKESTFYWLLAVLTGLVMPLSAQVNPLGYTTRHFSTSEGLSNNKITTIFQDQSGWIWIGTNYGLNRYNGQRITSYLYQPGQSVGLAGNYIFDLCQSADETFWVGTRGKGLSCFQVVNGMPQWECSTHILNQAVTSKNIRKLDQSAPHKLYLGTAMGLFEKEDFQWPPRQITSDFVFEMDLQEEQLWLADAVGISHVDLSTGLIKEIPLAKSQNILAIHALDSSTIIFVTRSSVQKLSKKNNQWQESEIYRSLELESHAIHTSFLKVGEQIWMAIGNQLMVLDQQLQVIDRYDHREILNMHTDDLTISTMLLDRDQNVWIGSDKGLFQLTRVKQFSDSNILTDSEASGLFRDCIKLDQGLWMATWDGLYFKGTSTGKMVKVSDIQLQTLFLASDGTLYGGAAWESTPGLYVIDTNDYHIHQYSQMEDAKNSFVGGAIYAFAETESGRIWIGAWDGFQYFDPVTKTFTRFHLPFDDITDLEIYRQDLWVATVSGGLYRVHDIDKILDSADLRYTQYQYDQHDPRSLSSNMVFAIERDAHNRLWIGTEAGLNCYLEKQNKFKRFFRNQEIGAPMAENMFFALVADANDRIWYGTIGQGLGFYDPVAERFHHFSQYDGLPNNNILQNSASLDDFGNLYFGSEEKCIVFHPDQILKQKIGPKPLFLESVLSRSNQKDSVDFLRPKRLVDAKYTFTAKDFDYSFDFVCPTYGNPRHYEYEYRLEDLHTNWISNGSSGKIVFAQLPPGKYVLKARITHLMEDWRSQAGKVVIEVLPVWYKSNLAIVASSVFVIGMIIWITHFFIAKRSQKMSEICSEQLRNLVRNSSIRSRMSFSHPSPSCAASWNRLSQQEICRKCNLAN